MDSGWRCVRGAGGYSYWHDARRWATKVYDTQAEAASAADKLEAGALATVERAERERVELREALQGDNNAVQRDSNRSALDV